MHLDKRGAGNLTYLLAERIVKSDGLGPHVELEEGKALDVTLGIESVPQQEALVVSISGSQDGVEWGDRPLITFTPKSYCGTYRKLLNLSKFPGVRYFRAEWKMQRWTKSKRPMEFAFYVLAQEADCRTSSAVA